MDVKEHIAKTIKALRKAKGYTQRELAMATGISLSAIIAYENQQREPNSRNMALLERFFHVSGAYLRGEERETSAAFHLAQSDHVESKEEVLIMQVLDAMHRDTMQNYESYEELLELLAEVSKIGDAGKRTLFLTLAKRVLKEMLISFQA